MINKKESISIIKNHILAIEESYKDEQTELENYNSYLDMAKSGCSIIESNNILVQEYKFLLFFIFIFMIPFLFPVSMILF